jgi:hypothetical protein
MVNPLHANKIVIHKPHFLCKISGHNYQSVVWINNCENSLTGYSVCKRCGDIAGTTTFGPFHIEI